MKQRFGLLATAAGRVASPQIRNAGTLGGNISQDTRCWYYRGGVDCYRAGGNMCYADTPQGQNREHAIFNASRCVAVTPSDTANALVALDASMVIRAQGRRARGARGAVLRRSGREHPAHDGHRAGRDPRWPCASPPPGRARTFYFEKVADRTVWDFALLSHCGGVQRMEGDDHPRRAPGAGRGGLRSVSARRRSRRR